MLKTIVITHRLPKTGNGILWNQYNDSNKTDNQTSFSRIVVSVKFLLTGTQLILERLQAYILDRR